MKNQFIETFNCTNIPKQVIELYESNDISEEFFDFEKIKDEYNGNFKEFISSGIKHDKSDLLIPIAKDGMGGYYAFVGNKEDENIYYFDNEFPDDEPLEFTIEEIVNGNME